MSLPVGVAPLLQDARIHDQLTNNSGEHKSDFILSF